MAMAEEEKRIRQRESHKRWRARNPEKMKAARQAWNERNPEKVRAYGKTPKELERRAAAKRNLRANDSAWAERERARNMERRRSEEYRLATCFRTADWRARQIGSPGASYCTLEKLIARLELYGYRCAYCGCERATEIDHMIPLARGGTAFPSNIVPACRSCNASKGVKTPKAFGALPSLVLA